MEFVCILGYQSEKWLFLQEVNDARCVMYKMYVVELFYSAWCTEGELAEISDPVRIVPHGNW